MKQVRFCWGHAKIDTRATMETSTTVSSIRKMLRDVYREDLLNRMPVERRDIYEHIRKLRDKIGPVHFDVLGALRELRENG